MGKTLVIAEKPSVGRDYARVLDCRQQGEGCLIGDQYVVTWAVGHLVELCPPEAYDPRYKKWNYADLPIMPERIRHEVIPASRKQYEIVKSWMNSDQISHIVCGTDSGREGELIFRYIYYMAGCRKPFSRLWVSSMTEEAISQGFRELKDGREYDRLYQSARCRSEADWLVGINGSRAYTLRYDTLLSIGRVQTPTLALIVNRQREIDEFVPKEYFEVRLQHRLQRENDEAPEFASVWFTPEEGGRTKNTRIDERARAEEICERAGAAGVGKVTEVTRTKKKTPPPLLYDLTELQRDGNRKYGYSANKVLSIAQALYEKHKLITYPRTDSRYLSEDMKAVIPSVLKAIRIDELADSLDKMPPLAFSKRIIDNSKITDHHAIIPTSKRPNLERLSEEERRIYLLVARRLIEAFYPPYEYEATEAVISVGEDLFLARGRTVLNPGFTVVSGKGAKSSVEEGEEEAQGQLPRLKKGDAVSVEKAEVLSKQTQPPKAYTEASLLTAMEYAGKYVEDEALREQMSKLSLGTPATRAAVIERLLQVNYITRKGKSLLPTEKGKELIRIVPAQLKSPEMTGKWERALERIYQGGMEPERFMESIRRYVRFIVGEAGGSGKTVGSFPKEERGRRGTGEGKPEPAGLGLCPLCRQGRVLKNSKSYYCSRWKQGCRFTVWKDTLDRYGVPLDDGLMEELLKNGSRNAALTLPQTGEKGEGTLYFTEQGRLEIKNFRSGGQGAGSEQKPG